MKVLMLGWEFPPHLSGGLGTACWGLSRALAARGAQVRFVVPHAVGDEDDRHVEIVSADAFPAGDEPAVLRVPSALLPYLSRAGYERRRLELETRDRGGPRGARVAYGRDLFSEVARYAASTRAIAAPGGFDVVHAHDWMTFPAGIAAKEVSGAPLVAHVHATEHDRSADAPDPAIRAVEEAGLRAADRVICVSRRSAGVVRRRYRVDARKLRVVHNGVVPLRTPRGRLARARGAGPVVLFLGRVTAQKGPLAFLDAAARVLREIPRATFVVAGGGDLLPAAIERAAHLRIARRVRFAGFLRGADVAAAYAAADVFVMPSRSEPFGIAPLEAMSLGIPAVVSSASGVCEVVEHVVRVPPGRPATLAARLVELLRDPRRRARLSRDGRREARALSWDLPAAEVLAVYAETAA